MKLGIAMMVAAAVLGNVGMMWIYSFIPSPAPFRVCIALVMVWMAGTLYCIGIDLLRDK